MTETGLPGDGGSLGRGKELVARLASASRPPISGRVTGERRAKWLGMSAVMPDATVQLIDSMPSWLAAVTVGMATEISRVPATSDGADEQLRQLFRQVGKPVQAIEDSDAVVAGLGTMSGAQQDRMLEDALDAVGRPETLAERMAPYHAWALGEHQLDRYWTDANRASYAQTLRERLLVSRNTAWADELGRRMATPGVVLVAVGAGHLDGRNSLLELLAARGFRIRRVSPEGTPAPRPAFLPKPAKWSDCNGYLFGDRVPQAGG